MRVYGCSGPLDKGLRLEAGEGEVGREGTWVSEYLHMSSGHVILDSDPTFLHFRNLV